MNAENVRSEPWMDEQEAALAHAQSERGWADFYDFDDDVKRWDTEIARLKASIEERRRSSIEALSDGGLNHE